MKARALTVAALAVLLSACAGTAVRGSAPTSRVVVGEIEAEAAQSRRETALRAQAQWSLSGRIALSNGRNGGSGRIDWRQDGDRYEIALSAPVTRQSWRLSGDAAGARLEGVEGGPRSGPDAAALLREATGWDIPVAALKDWVRGLRAQDVAQVQVTYANDGRPLRIEQGGWRIDYRWPEAGAAGPALPTRLDAMRDKAKVKLIVDAWQVAEPFAAAQPFRQGREADPLGLEPLRSELTGLNLFDPAADLRANVARGDLRAISICGYSCEPPGLTGADRDVQGSRILLGTGDVITSPEYGQLLDQARAYALSYNRALSEWLRTHPRAPFAKRD